MDKWIIMYKRLMWLPVLFFPTLVALLGLLPFEENKLHNYKRITIAK